MPDIKSLLPAIDAWTASSLLQKAIRRGETEYAQAAAINFHKLRGNAIWRRLTLIAYEDIGIGDLPSAATLRDMRLIETCGDKLARMVS